MRVGGLDRRRCRPNALANNWRNGGDEGGTLLGRQSQRFDKLIDGRPVRSAAVGFEALDRPLAEAGPPCQLGLTEAGLDSVHPDQAAEAPRAASVEHVLLVCHQSPVSS